MTQTTSTSSSLLAQLTPMLSDRAVIMVVSNVDDQHLDGVSDSQHTIKCSKPGRRSGGSAIAGQRAALIVPVLGAPVPGITCRSGFSPGALPRWCVRMTPWVRQAGGSDYASP